jgi:hypothetical protein
MLRISRLVCGLALVVLLLQAAPIVLAQSQDLIVDICTTPNKYWNKPVALKGHVVKVTPDPPGTNRGRYTLRDQSDKDIEINTDDLPAQGKVYIIHGVVEQRKAGDNIPVVHENSRVLAQPDSPMTAAPAQAPSAPSAMRSAAPVAKATAKTDIEEAVRKQLEKERSAQAPPPATAAPAPAVASTPIPAEPSASPSGLNPTMIGLIAIVVLVVIAVIVVVMKKKPEAPVYAPAPAPMPTQVSSATQVSSGSATMVASKGTEVFTRLGGELTVAEGPDRGRTLAIGKPTILIGRSGQRKNDFELSDSTTSREQAKVVYNSADRSFRIVNESTTNPTRVNGSSVDSAVLQDGDKIEFGNTVVKFKKT